MIEGAEALTVSEEAKQSHEHEEQCLFFVAMSRAQVHLRIYLARLQPNGRNRSPSPFLCWIPVNLVTEIAHPKTFPLPQGASKSETVSVAHAADSRVTDSSLNAYQKCPRRYFYTHVLGLGAAKKSTAFLRTHNCLYDLIRWLAETRPSGEPTLETAEAAFEAIWRDRGPVDHGFAPDYRRLASRLIAALINSGAGRRFRDAEPIALDLPNGRVIVEPNEMAELPNGTVVLRRVRTGYKRTDEYDRLDYTLYHLAGQSRFGTRFAVEAIHLTDDTIETVTITAQKLGNRRASSDSMLAKIGKGLFPPEIDSVTCPRCPHFFVCAAVPKGPLKLS
jgi:hypothetical protein